MCKTKKFLNYVALQEEAILIYWASDIVLAAHSDASYLNETETQSRVGGHIFLSLSLKERGIAI